MSLRTAGIARLAGGDEYAKFLLRARRDFERGHAATIEEIREVYLRAAEGIRNDINSLAPGTLRHAHLTALQKNLDDRAAQMSKEILAATHNGIWMASEAGSKGVADITAHMVKDAFPEPAIKRLFAGLNERATLAMLARTRRDGLKISDRVWRTTEIARNSIQRILEDAVARGQDARRTAREIQQYLQPGIWKAHKLETRKRLGIGTDVSYQAMRLARTEMNNAFHEGMITANQHNPGYRGIYWRLSTQHVVPDICTNMAADVSYGEPGFYPKGKEPVRPHPQCLCVAVGSYEDPGQFAQRLNEWSQNPHLHPELEKWYNEDIRRFMGRTVISLPLPTPPAKPPPPPPPEEVHNFRTLGGGVSETWTGEIAGKKYVFKSPKPIKRMDMKTGNAEAELLAPRLLELAGVPAPKAFYKKFKVEVAGKKKTLQLLQMEFIDGVDEIDAITIRDIMAGFHPLNIDKFRRMQVADVLMGNGDRHARNIFIRIRGANVGDIVPIDHNFAFGTDSVIDPKTTWQKCFTKSLSRNLVGYQKPTHIMGRSTRYANYVMAESTRADYQAVVSELKLKLTDNIIDQWVEELPKGMIKVTRMNELKDIMKWRRDNLDILVDEGIVGKVK